MSRSRDETLHASIPHATQRAPQATITRLKTPKATQKFDLQNISLTAEKLAS
jgi:hypothetical protein